MRPARVSCSTVTCSSKRTPPRRLRPDAGSSEHYNIDSRYTVAERDRTGKDEFDAARHHYQIRQFMTLFERESHRNRPWKGGALRQFASPACPRRNYQQPPTTVIENRLGCNALILC